MGKNRLSISTPKHELLDLITLPLKYFLPTNAGALGRCMVVDMTGGFS